MSSSHSNSEREPEPEVVGDDSNSNGDVKEVIESKIAPLTANNLEDFMPQKEDDSLAAFLQQAKPLLNQIWELIRAYSTRKIMHNMSVYQIFFCITTLTAVADVSMPFRIVQFILQSCLTFVLSVIGLSISIGLGLGFGAHMYEILDKHSFDRAQQQLQKSQELELSSSSSKLDNKTKKPYKIQQRNNNITEHSDNGDASYYALMARSGYPQPSSNALLLRGQLRPRSSIPTAMDYNTVGVRAAATMRQMWPNLPKDINEEFGMLIDLIVRDYVVSWFGSVDAAIVYNDPKLKSTASSNVSNDSTPTSTDANLTTKESERVLTTSITSYKASPFLNTLSAALSHLLGQLCTTAAENVNIVDLILIKIVKAITKTLKHYRRARKVALLRQESYQRSKHTAPDADSNAGPSLLRRGRGWTSGRNLLSESNSEETSSQPPMSRKNSKIGLSDKDGNDNSTHSQASSVQQSSCSTTRPKNKISEIAITKELLISNRLHKAITFGLDVPSLLFSDPKGEKARISSVPSLSSDPLQNSEHAPTDSDSDGPLEDTVLYHRLYNTPILQECELDYNRVISNKIVRKIVPASDLSSPIIKNFAVEVVAGSILGPIMSFFCPEVVNDYIVQGVDGYLNQQADTNTTSTTTTTTTSLDASNGSHPDPEGEKLNNNLDATDVTLVEKGGVGAPQREESIGMDNNENNEQKESPTNGYSDSDEKGQTNVRKVSIAESEDGGIEMENSDSAKMDDSFFTNNDSFFDQGEATMVDEEEEDMNEEFDAEDVGEDVGEDEGDIVDDDLLDIVDDKSVQSISTTSELNPPSDLCTEEAVMEQTESKSAGENNATINFLPILTLAVLDVQNFVQAGSNNEDGEVDWENKTCRAAVCHLVLVIEAALQHGRKVISHPSPNTSMEESEQSKEVDSMLGTSLIDLLMDMTMNIEDFEKTLTKRTIDGQVAFEDDSAEILPHDVFKHESSTLRTMIVAWLQTGDIYKAIRVIASSEMLRRHFYTPAAVFRHEDLPTAFCNQLKLLDGVDVLVDTMAVLEAESVDFDASIMSMSPPSSPPSKTLTPSSPPRLESEPETETSSEAASYLRSAVALPSQTLTMLGSNVKANMRTNRNRLSRWTGLGGNNINATDEAPAVATNNRNNQTQGGLVRLRQRSKLLDHLNFHRNESLANKLRVERAQKYETWKKATIHAGMTSNGKYKMIEMVCTDSSRPIHRDLHYFSRVIYGSTLSIAVEGKTIERKHNQITTTTVSGRRMLEVPDDDSSFLLRAQPRPLKPLGVHKDQYSHENHFKAFNAYYEEPVTHPVTKRYNGGRQIRYCILNYFPSNRTATVIPKPKLPTMYTEEEGEMTILATQKSFYANLPDKIRNERNPCQKAQQRASTMTSVMLLSNLMEPTDFNSTPRTGKAIDFVYKLSLFERPMVEVSGKKFTVYDGNAKNVHRADASALELSDASLTTAIILSGEKQSEASSSAVVSRSISEVSVPSDETDSDEIMKEQNSAQDPSMQTNSDSSISCEIVDEASGMDALSVKIKVVNSGGEGAELVKCFRPSFVRAVLLATSARQDAQLQCLLWSVKVGSARQATRARTEGLLQPTLSLLDFANSKGRDKESILIRNLKFGSSHVEKEKLRRNKILNPRHPTLLRGFNVKIEGWVREQSQNEAVTFVYKIRCLALTETDVVDDYDNNNNIIENHDQMHPNEDGSNAEARDGKRKVYKEEWVIKRSFKEFMTLHKHLKTQMSPTAASGVAGPRFAAATAAVFATGGGANDGARHRKGMLLSLAHAAKIGALGATRKSLDRRKEILDEYLKHLLSPTNLLRRCSEVLQFLGADSPLEYNHPHDFVDEYGRSEIRRVQMDATFYPEVGAPAKALNEARSGRDRMKKQAMEEFMKRKQKESGTANNAESPIVKQSGSHETETNDETSSSASTPKLRIDPKKMAIYKLVKSKVDKVTLADARETGFEFIRHLFDLDNATFFRSRMVSVLRTMSLVVTSAQEFNSALLQMHMKYINGEYLGSCVKSIYDGLWPNGVWYTAKPPMTQEEKDTLEARSKDKLFEVFPDQIKTVLGQELSHDGLSVLHEMFQNRVVVKSLGYMIMDMVWLEIFPELDDILSGTEALDDDE